MERFKKYQILLILTDGTIHDVQRTKQLLVRLSVLPCSIIIVGIGNADFSAMEELDGELGILRDDLGTRCARDLVQFIEYRASSARGDF